MDALYLSELQAFLRYTVVPGREPALVYLTGLGLATTGTYDRCIGDPTLGARRAVLVDFLGAGFSDAPEAFSYTLEDHARSVAILLDHLGLRASPIVAYSFGGAVAVTLAATRSDLAASLVLAEPNLDPGGGFLSRRIAAQSEAEFRTRGFSELVGESIAKGRSGSQAWAITSGMLQVASAHGLYRSAVGLVKGTRPTMRERLLRLSIPRTLIRGEASGPNPHEDELEARGVQLLFVPRAAHGMMWENPDGFVAAVTAGVGR